MENNTVKKTAKNNVKIITLQPENAEKYKIKDYHDLHLQVDVLLSVVNILEIIQNYI